MNLRKYLYTSSFIATIAVVFALLIAAGSAVILQKQVNLSPQISVDNYVPIHEVVTKYLEARLANKSDEAKQFFTPDSVGQSRKAEYYGALEAELGQLLRFEVIGARVISALDANSANGSYEVKARLWFEASMGRGLKYMAHKDVGYFLIPDAENSYLINYYKEYQFADPLNSEILHRYEVEKFWLEEALSNGNKIKLENNNLFLGSKLISENVPAILKLDPATHQDMIGSYWYESNASDLTADYYKIGVSKKDDTFAVVYGRLEKDISSTVGMQGNYWANSILTVALIYSGDGKLIKQIPLKNLDGSYFDPQWFNLLYYIQNKFYIETFSEISNGQLFVVKDGKIVKEIKDSMGISSPTLRYFAYNPQGEGIHSCDAGSVDLSTVRIFDIDSNSDTLITSDFKKAFSIESWSPDERLLLLLIGKGDSNGCVQAYINFATYNVATKKLEVNASSDDRAALERICKDNRFDCSGALAVFGLVYSQ